MRNPIPFDTHAFVKRLTSVGFTEAQAEVQADALSGLVYGELATKKDLQEAIEPLAERLDKLEARMDKLEAGMEKLEGRMEGLERRFEQMELRMTVRMGAMMAVGIGIIAVLVKLL